jgi:hypothetical protein
MKSPMMVSRASSMRSSSKKESKGNIKKLG